MNRKDGFSQAILDWYDRNARELPWRRLGGAHPEPYHVWLSEIMLQQTTVVTVKPYFNHFISRWPQVSDLAAAELDEVLTAWAGLGYYARARNLHKCAVAVCHNYGGSFPADEAELLSLPGIGDYTAAAVSSIAFGKRAVVVDGNIERVVSRVYRIADALPQAKPVIKAHADVLTPSDRAGDYAQALMDIGSGVCTPRNPKCELCPVASFCDGFSAGDAETFPQKAPKKKKPTRKAHIFWIENGRGEVLVRRREESGLLGGMMEFPSTAWQEQAPVPDEVEALLTQIGVEGTSKPPVTTELVRHTFTHFHLELTPHVVKAGEAGGSGSNDAFWLAPDAFSTIALPTLMKKVVQSVFKGQGSLDL
ncbi:A/G-specific adenine glycosylase [Sneathiella chinensis]|uniref:Adenine DNA glycosylase n=1 Tax=Sneathiella chinensis TaxID=349750 RepID=A0ABQ5U1G5_9PROT|nr:A/G-specific adenine glycosylase [Sneathiella chinensis]GLQ05699.1 A/G-specific adenine glycosylase [Sneathiella chinensis]